MRTNVYRADVRRFAPPETAQVPLLLVEPELRSCRYHRCRSILAKAKLRRIAAGVHGVGTSGRRRYCNESCVAIELWSARDKSRSQLAAEVGAVWGSSPHSETDHDDREAGDCGQHRSNAAHAINCSSRHPPGQTVSVRGLQNAVTGQVDCPGSGSRVIFRKRHLPTARFDSAHFFLAAYGCHCRSWNSATILHGCARRDQEKCIRQGSVDVVAGYLHPLPRGIEVQQRRLVNLREELV
jgi:hypothetical protein